MSDVPARVAAGRGFAARVRERAEAIAPGLRFVEFEAGRPWSAEDCDAAIYAGDGFSEAFVTGIRASARLRWVHTEDAGTDAPVYREWLARRIQITHSPGANAPAVAEFALSLLLFASKKLAAFVRAHDARSWRKHELETLEGRTLLVVGLGAVGRQLADHARALGMRVVGVRRSGAPVHGVHEVVPPAGLASLLPEADAIVLAAPLTPATRALLGEAEFARAKPGAILVNVGRGELLDVRALARALREGRLGAACLDVLPKEPWPANDPLWEVPNLLITPHNAWSSPHTLARVGAMWLENLERRVRGEALRYEVHVLDPV